MKIFSLKRMTIPKVAVLVTGITAALLVATVGAVPAQAKPGYTQDCTGCHGSGFSFTATPSTATPASGATYTVKFSSSVDGYWITGSGVSAAGGSASSVSVKAPAAAGAYTYNVYARNGNGGKTTYNITVGSVAPPTTPPTSTTPPPAGAAPTASFTATSRTGVAPVVVGLTGSATNNPTSWAWDFGNGKISSAQNPWVSYATPGVYTIKLTARNAAGTSAPVSQSINVTLTAPPAGSPSANFTASATTGVAPLTVNLTNTSTGSPTSYEWDFGNGNTSTAQNPWVTYAAVGTYTVTLTATNAIGSSTVTETITVTATGTTPPTTPAPPATTVPPATSAAVISSLSPNNGGSGDRITISGTGFGQAGVVKFGTVTASVSSWSTTRISVTVPREGSNSQVSVTVIPANGTASNGRTFDYGSSDDD